MSEETSGYFNFGIKLVDQKRALHFILSENSIKNILNQIGFKNM